jgi:GNAT superfamily N-acetyltransferase
MRILLLAVKFLETAAMPSRSGIDLARHRSDAWFDAPGPQGSSTAAACEIRSVPDESFAGPGRAGPYISPMTLPVGYTAGVTRGIRVEPVTRQNWEMFVRLFDAKGSPHFCWCTSYRVRSGQELSDAQKKASMRRLVDAGTPVGVLAFREDEPIGWCSVAPRQTYVRLERSRTMPRVTSSATQTWTVLCFFVARPYRNQHVTRSLLDGAVDYARQQGAEVVEGYPFDTAGITSTHRGHSRTFEAAGFQPDGNRWARRFR